MHKAPELRVKGPGVRLRRLVTDELPARQHRCDRADDGDEVLRQTRPFIHVALDNSVGHAGRDAKAADDNREVLEKAAQVVTICQLDVAILLIQL